MLVNDYRKANIKFIEISKQLNEAKAEEKIRIDEHWNIALCAGVPSEYLNNIYVEIHKDNTACIYFGGLKEADGLGHGYYIVDVDGKATHIQECSNVNLRNKNGFRILK